MNLHPIISIHEAAEILRTALQEKLGEPVAAITIASYEKPVVEIGLDQNVAGDGKTPTHRWNSLRSFTHYTVP